MRLQIQFFLSLYILFLLQGCTETKDGVATFVSTLGKDTLVIEQFTINNHRIDAEIMMRVPNTRFIQQILTMGENKQFQEFSSATYDPNDIGGKPIEVQKMIVEDDSLVVTTIRDTFNRVRKFAYNPTMIPWFDMIHWPYEVATKRMQAENLDQLDQSMLTGRNVAIFEIRRIEEDSISIKHPYRGTMNARINESGSIEYYDATNTTRKLIVRRGGPMDMISLTKKYAQHPIGALSGSGSTTSLVHGAQIKLTFGQPARRNRQLFGGIVPWNKRWRTGANRATHFNTDKDLQIGGLEVPAGEYTLFTIPTPDGGTLIINKQTGQNGNRYDKTRDLGRVPMSITTNEESIELFTIKATEREEKGILQLMWGNTIFEVEFTVLN